MKYVPSIKHRASTLALVVCFLLLGLKSFGSFYEPQEPKDSTKKSNVFKTIEKKVGSFFHSDSAKRAKHYVHQQQKFTKENDGYPYEINSGGSKSGKVKVVLDTNTQLAYEVMGWYPFWEKDLYKSLNFSLLTTTAYFDYELNPDNGTAKTIHDWKTTSCIDSAQASGNKVLLTVTNFGAKNNKQFLNSQKAINAFVKNIISALHDRGANGVCIDFEGISTSEKKAFSDFIVKLRASLSKPNKDYAIYITIPCVDWDRSYDFKVLNPLVDRFVMMGYSYYGSFSKVAGPISPASSGKVWEAYNLENSIDYYLKVGVSAKQLILALPYFGSIWETKSDEKKSEVKAFIGNRTYDYIQTSIKAPVQYDMESQTAWYSYEVNDKSSVKYRQCWFDNDSTLGLKMELIKRKGLGGMAIWALGYDKGADEMWTTIVKKMTVSKGGTSGSKKTVDSSGVAEAGKDNNGSSGIWDRVNGIEEVLGEVANYKAIIAAVILFVLLFGGAGVVIAMLIPTNRDFFFGSTGRIMLFSILMLCVLLLFLRLIGFLADMQVAVVVGFICGAIALFAVYKINFRMDQNKP